MVKRGWSRYTCRFWRTIRNIIERGLVDVIVTTGANVYHDLHFACGLPVRHGSDKVDDNDLRADETTRIYNQFIHNRYTLKAQDMLNQEFARKLLPRLKQPFSTATLLYNLGRDMLEDDSGIVVDRKGSFVLRAAEYNVPIFLDSGSNHSLGMDLSLLAWRLECGYEPNQRYFGVCSIEYSHSAATEYLPWRRWTKKFHTNNSTYSK